MPVENFESFVDCVAVGQVFVRILLFSPVSITHLCTLLYEDERGMAGHLENAVFFRKMRALDRKILPRVASEGCEFRTVTWLNEEVMARCM